MLPNIDVNINTKIMSQINYYGYIDIIDKNQSNINWVVVSIVERGKIKL